MVFVTCYVSVCSSKDKVFWASALLTVVLQGCAQCDNIWIQFYGVSTIMRRGGGGGVVV